MNFQSQKKKGNISFIDFTPLVDMVFNLIIFFALSFNFIGTPAIKLKLPQASSKETVKENKELRVFITRGIEKEGYTHGNFIVDGSQFSYDDLEKLINQRYSQNNDLVIIIQADERVAQGEVVKVMDIAKSAGIEKIAIATRQKEK